MNERLMRAAPKNFATFVTAFEEDKAEARPAKPGASPGQSRGSEEEDNPLWLVMLLMLRHKADNCITSQHVPFWMHPPMIKGLGCPEWPQHVVYLSGAPHAHQGDVSSVSL